MPSQQHEQWKQDLFDHLDRKLRVCISCGFGEGRDSHVPTYREWHCEPSTQVLWTCERMHPQSYDLLRGAGFVVAEQLQPAPVNGRCRPDITTLNTHRDPLAFVETVRSNRPTNPFEWRKSWAFRCLPFSPLTGGPLFPGSGRLGLGGTLTQACRRRPSTRCISWNGWQTS